MSIERVQLLDVSRTSDCISVRFTASVSNYDGNLMIQRASNMVMSEFQDNKLVFKNYNILNYGPRSTVTSTTVHATTPIVNGPVNSEEVSGSDDNKSESNLQLYLIAALVAVAIILVFVVVIVVTQRQRKRSSNNLAQNMIVDSMLAGTQRNSINNITGGTTLGVPSQLESSTVHSPYWNTNPTYVSPVGGKHNSLLHAAQMRQGQVAIVGHPRLQASGMTPMLSLSNVSGASSGLYSTATASPHPGGYVDIHPQPRTSSALGKTETKL